MARNVRTGLTSQLPRLIPGLLVALAITAASVLLGDAQRAVFGLAFVEPLVIALLLGIVVRSLSSTASETLMPGTSFAAKQLLEVGVVVLGTTLDFGRVLAAGFGLVWLIVAVVAAAIPVSYLIGRAVGLSPRLAILVSVGNAICGNSAIIAVAPVIGAQKREVTSAIALTAVIGIGLIVGLPALIPLLKLDHYQYGVVAGMSAYAVPQVVAASFPVSQLAGQVATSVKLIRILLLGPVVLAFAVGARRGQGRSEGRRGWSTFLPWFVAGFLVAAIARNAGAVPDQVAGPARDVSGMLMTIAMAGLGYGVRAVDIQVVGLRVAIAVVVSLAFIFAATLTHIGLLGIHM